MKWQNILSLVILLGSAQIARAELTPESCLAAQRYSAEHRGLSLLVLKDDRTFFEGFSNGHGPEKVASIFSGTKGFWCVGAAAAEEDGILSFDETVADTIKEWQSDPNKSQIRIRDLLSFTAGIEPVFALHGKSISDRNAYSVRLPAVARAGGAFMYGPSELQIFCEVLKRKLATRHQTPQQYLTRRVLRPLGLGSVDFREDNHGNPLLASGFKLTARQWAQLGVLILHDGNYGHRQLVRSEHLNRLFRGTRANPVFGMGFWLNRTNEFGNREVDVEKMLERPWQREDWQHVCLAHAAPRDLIAAIGSGYQRMFISPTLNLVVVRQGRDSSFSDAKFLEILLGR